MRRSLGITQEGLADHLGVRQSMISRWETGSEPISRRSQLQLLDLFTNQRDQLHPVIGRLIRRTGDVSVATETGRYLRVSNVFAQRFALNPSEVIGTDSERWHWHDPSMLADVSIKHGETLLERGLLMVEEEGDCFLRKEHPGAESDNGARILCSSFAVRFDGHETVELTRTQILGPATYRSGANFGIIPVPVCG